MNQLEHNGYIGTIDHDLDEGILFGKVINMDGNLMYEGATLGELQANFRGVIDAYIAMCEEKNEEPRKPFSGKIALRIDPVQHARVAAIAESQGVSMNQWLADAIAAATTSVPGGADLGIIDNVATIHAHDVIHAKVEKAEAVATTKTRTTLKRPVSKGKSVARIDVVKAKGKHQSITVQGKSTAEGAAKSVKKR